MAEEQKKIKETETKINEEMKKEEICHKKACQNRSNELTRIKEENIGLKKNFLGEYRRRVYLLKENVKMYTHLWGNNIFKQIGEILDEERAEIFEKAPKLKDEKGEEIKCSVCKNSIMVHQDLDKDFFQAFDEKWYCFDCYEKKHLIEFNAKIKKVGEAKTQEEAEKNKTRETEIKLNSHSVFKHPVNGEVKIKDVSIIFLRDKNGLGMYRTVVGVGEKEKRQILTNQVESKGIGVGEYYKLELFIDDRLIETKKLEDKDVHQKVDFKVNDHIVVTFYDESVNLDDIKIEKGENEWNFTIKNRVYKVEKAIAESNPNCMDLKLFISDKISQQKAYQINKEVK